MFAWVYVAAPSHRRVHVALVPTVRLGVSVIMGSRGFIRAHPVFVGFIRIHVFSFGRSRGVHSGPRGFTLAR